MGVNLENCHVDSPNQLNKYVSLFDSHGPTEKPTDWPQAEETSQHRLVDDHPEPREGGAH